MRGNTYSERRIRFIHLSPGVLLGFVLAGLLAGGWAPDAAAQSWSGTGRAQGEILDEDDRPIEGATVTLRLDASPSEGPEPVATDAKGRWRFLGLTQGRWRIAVKAEGYLDANGWVDVPNSGPAQAVTVQLRPLTELSPGGWEGNPTTIIGWLEKGNTLLAQERYPEARAEYEKAIPVLPDDQKPDVFRSVARTHFLEGDRDAAVVALKKALIYAPQDGVSRQLFTGVLEGLGRRAEAETWLRRLEDEGTEFAREELGMDQAGGANAAQLAQVRELLAAPPDPPKAHRVGDYRTAFTERSPLSGIERFAEIYGLTLEEIGGVDPAVGRYELSEETFDVHVPEGYDPSESYGLFVWISPTPLGGVRSDDLKQVLAERKLIWIGANRAGNARPKWTRMGLALDAAHNMTALYSIDPRRVYVAGYSGGGRSASAAALHYSEVFRGGYYVYGVDFYQPVPVPDKPGANWPAAFPPPPKDKERKLKKESRFVFLTGERDFNRAQTKRYFREYGKEGFEHLTYLEIPGATHYTRVDGEWFDKAIAALDAPLGRRGGR